MVTLSNFVVIGIIEAFMLLLVCLAFVTLLYRRAQNRIMLLGTQLRQLKETTVFLLEKVNNFAPGSDTESTPAATNPASKAPSENSLVPETKTQSASQPAEQAEKTRDGASELAVAGLKEDADNQKKLISELLAKKDAAESEVSIKVEELKKLERYLQESEVCIKLLEDEIDELHKGSSENQDSKQIDEMKKLIQNFTRESSEMLASIESLEGDNERLREQLKALTE